MFDFLETFFFLSLGITFVLILLLVYHFKERVQSLEHKNDTMFEIINNVVKELSFVRNFQSQSFMKMPNIFSSNNDTIVREEICNPSIPSNNKSQLYEIDEDDEEDDEDDEDEDEDEDDDEDDDEDEDEDAAEDHAEDQHQDEDNVKNPIKIVNVDIGNQIEFIEPLEIDLDTDQTENESPLIEMILNEDEQVHVQKLENEQDADEENETQISNSESESTNIISKDIYRKMTLNSLKTFVITKGLCSDPSKLKKNELLKIIESADI